MDLIKFWSFILGGSDNVQISWPHKQVIIQRIVLTIHTYRNLHLILSCIIIIFVLIILILVYITIHYITRHTQHTSAHDVKLGMNHKKWKQQKQSSNPNLWRIKMTLIKKVLFRVQWEVHNFSINALKIADHYLEPLFLIDYWLKINWSEIYDES